MIPIPEVDNVPYVNNAEFVKLTIYNPNNSTTTHTFSSSYKNEIIDGTNFIALGGLLSISTQQRDLRVTSSDTSVTLSGLSSEYQYLVLGTQIKGSKIEIWRGFYDDNYILTNTVRRFTGIITSYSIVEDLQNNDDNFSISVNCSSFKTILENKVSGRKTNSNSWKEFNPTDVSMDNVQALDGAFFDFGRKVTQSGADSSSTTLTATVRQIS